MAIGVGLEEVTFSDGTVVGLPPEGIVLFVGPNSAGKSLALREISAFLTSPQYPSVPNAQPTMVITSASFRSRGDTNDLVEWLNLNAPRGTLVGSRSVPLGPDDTQAVGMAWDNGAPYGPLSPYLHLFLGAEGRTALVGSASLWDLANESPTSPLQRLFLQKELELELQKAVAEAFSLPVFVNRVAGLHIYLQCGNPSPITTFPPSLEYIQTLATLPHVQDQGDGVKSFVGVELALTATPYPIVLIDEPEAFLHPPQAWLLGRNLARFTKGARQVICATHSSSVLRGVLSSPGSNVTVIRLERRGRVNGASVLSHDSIDRFWDDPILRHSNVLDGIFYRGVVVSEADSDSRFYSAALDEYLEQREAASSDLLFTQSGGKARIPKVVSALKAVNVPVRVVGDIDVLDTPELLRSIVQALGADWSSVEALHKRVTAGVAATSRALRIGQVLKRVQEVLADSDDEAILTAQQSSQLKKVIKAEGGWNGLKKAGTTLLSGTQYSELLALLSSLEAVGLFLVPLGELERFAPEIGDHGPAWVSKALESGVHRRTEPQQFVERIYASFVGGDNSNAALRV